MAKGRKKPLMGAKRYSNMPLRCTVTNCEKDFFIAKKANPNGTRNARCFDHWKEGV